MIVAILTVAGCAEGPPREEANPPAAPPLETTAAAETATEPAAGYGTVAEDEPATTGSAAAPTPEESQWLEESLVLDSLSQVETAYEEFAGSYAAGELELELSIESLFGQGECREALAAAGPPPTERLEEIARLTRRACTLRQRADQNVILYETFDEETGERTVHEPDVDQALAQYERANELAGRARQALDAIGA